MVKRSSKKTKKKRMQYGGFVPCLPCAGSLLSGSVMWSGLLT